MSDGSLNSTQSTNYIRVYRASGFGCPALIAEAEGGYWQAPGGTLYTHGAGRIQIYHLVGMSLCVCVVGENIALEVAQVINVSHASLGPGCCGFRNKVLTHQLGMKGSGFEKAKPQLSFNPHKLPAMHSFSWVNQCLLFKQSISRL